MKALPQRNIEMNEYNSPLEMKSIFISETPYLFLFSLLDKGESDDFGNISVKTETAPALPKESQELLDIFDSLDKFHQVQVLEYARYFFMRENATKHKKG